MRKLFLLLLFILLAACDSNSPFSNLKTQSLESFIVEKDLSDIDTIIIQHGSGEEKMIQSHEQIEEFLLLIKDVVYSPQENQEGEVGWSFRIRLLEQKKEFDFLVNQIDDIYYDTNPDITHIVKEYFTSLETTEK